MTGTFFLALAAYVILAVLVGSIANWLVGRLLKLEVMTYPTSVSLELLTAFLNPFLPLAMFFLDYYLGLSLFNWSDPSQAGKNSALSLIPFVLTVALWLWLYKYLFEWDFMQSTQFWCAKSCITVLLIVIGAFVLIFTVAPEAGKRFQDGQKKQPTKGAPSSGEPERNWDVVNPSGIDIGQ